ncbi:MAG: hypothetical protein IPQ07_36780 [Myxococcales bacterium]|nr:hypothetical protein [Myxococcales bacterium]
MSKPMSLLLAAAAVSLVSGLAAGTAAAETKLTTTVFTASLAGRFLVNSR